MLFHPVLWLLIYLQVGTLVWAFAYSLGEGQENIPPRMRLLAAILCIIAWPRYVVIGWRHIRARRPRP